MPGPSGLDDAPQVVVEVYQPGPYTGTTSTYTYVTDEMGTTLAIVAEDEGGTATEPPVPVRYLYTPYGQAHAETGPELLRVRFDATATTARTAGGGTVTQEVPDPKDATPGALILTWSSPIAPASLPLGQIVERLAAGEGWVAVPSEEIAIGTTPSADPLTDTSAELRILRLAGWQEATSYRVRLTPTLEDRLGRPFGRSETLQWTIPAAPSEEDDVPPPQYEQRYPRRYESYEAAGTTAGGRFPGGQSRLFQGLWTDPVTGISYARARWLDTWTGAWLSEDPLGAVDSVNLYAFVAWQPSMATDPLGEDVEILVGRPYETAGGGWSPWGHVAIRIFDPDGSEYDTVYDYGRYAGDASGFLKNEGTGVLNIQEGPAYLRRESTHRDTIGYVVRTSEQEDRRVIEFFNNLASEGDRRRDVEKSLGYQRSRSFAVDRYNALGWSVSTCVVKTREACLVSGSAFLGDEIADALDELLPKNVEENMEELFNDPNDSILDRFFPPSGVIDARRFYPHGGTGVPSVVVNREEQLNKSKEVLQKERRQRETAWKKPPEEGGG